MQAWFYSSSSKTLRTWIWKKKLEFETLTSRRGFTVLRTIIFTKQKIDVKLRTIGFTKLKQWFEVKTNGFTKQKHGFRMGPQSYNNN